MPKRRKREQEKQQASKVNTQSKPLALEANTVIYNQGAIETLIIESAQKRGERVIKIVFEDSFDNVRVVVTTEPFMAAVVPTEPTRFKAEKARRLLSNAGEVDAVVLTDLKACRGAERLGYTWHDQHDDWFPF